MAVGDERAHADLPSHRLDMRSRNWALAEELGDVVFVSERGVVLVHRERAEHIARMLVVGGRGVLVLEDALACPREPASASFAGRRPGPSRASPSAVAPAGATPSAGSASARGAALFAAALACHSMIRRCSWRLAIVVRAVA